MPDELWHLNGTGWLGQHAVQERNPARALPRIPPAALRAARRAAGAMALAAGAMAVPLWLFTGAPWQAQPAEPGPLLLQARARGELVVGVHAYARPTPPGRPLIAQPDPGEAALATELGRALGVPVRLRHLPVADFGNSANTDIDLAFGAPQDAGHPRAAAVPAPATPRGTLLTLRYTPVSRLDALNGKTACVSAGGPFQPALARAGAVLRSYPSALQALLAFRRGECAAVAEDATLVARVMRLPEWRFFTAAPLVLDGEGAALALRQPDAQSARYLAQWLARWQRDGRLARLRDAAAGDAAFNMMLVESGLICH
ncbi:ABC transporter substrate-binding protein [Cupriavidus sp. UME77]|uniref:substrate-binding periplasmic protein n=1 Tax=Cupriavidus sp. UME77 TaxID=1862321 RepID=UPI00160332A4|nr:transporter substrate-binding domain-containing protein [Cupriavidus sp. UME77]MBB1631062.1 ABC transporter substrate-binding protein [Cupriavidus sp. UME77]